MGGIRWLWRGTLSVFFWSLSVRACHPVCIQGQKTYVFSSRARACPKAAMLIPPEAFFRAVPVRVPPLDLPPKRVQNAFPEGKTRMVRKEAGHSQVWRAEDAAR